MWGPARMYESTRESQASRSYRGAIIDDVVRTTTPVRRVLMATVMFILTGVVIEAMSFVVLSALDRRVATWSRLQEDRLAVADVVESAPEEAQASENTQRTVEIDPVERSLSGLNRRQVIHPYVGYVEPPRDDEVARGREGRNAEAGNYGFPRNTYGIFHDPGPETLVVVVVGGSFSRQIGFGGRRLIEQKLEAAPRFRGRDVVVISLGLGGYKQPQQLMVASYFLSLGMHMDVLVNIDGFNEVVLPVVENLRFGMNPFFPRGWSFRVAGLDPEELRLRGKIEHYRDLRVRRAVLFSQSPWRSSMTSSLVWRLLDRRVHGQAFAAEQEVRELGTGDAGYQALGPSFEVESDLQTAEELVAAWRRSSVLLDGLARKNGIEYYHFLQPNQYVEDSKPLTTEELRIAIDPKTGNAEPASRGYRLMSASAPELRDAGVDFVDLTGLFSDTVETVYVDSCCHVNHFGIELVVNRVVETIVEGGNHSSRSQPEGNAG